MKNLHTFESFSNEDAEIKKGVKESLVTEGQFSWMTQDTNTQIGSERENTIAVYMFSNKGEKWEEKRYKGYGEFGGKDYYELFKDTHNFKKDTRHQGYLVITPKK